MPRDDRPSLPYHRERVPTAPRTIVRTDDHAEAHDPPQTHVHNPPQTLTISLEDVPDDARRAAAAMGISIETWLRLFGIGADIAVRKGRSDKKLRDDLELGKLRESLNSVVGTLIGKRRRREMISIATAVGSMIVAIVLGVWRGVEGPAYRAASVDAIEPAIKARNQAGELEQRLDETSADVEEIKTSIATLNANVTTLQQAVLALTAKLPPAEPLPRDEVPAAQMRPRRSGR